jgi:hypothetical protein
MKKVILLSLLILISAPLLTYTRASGASANAFKYSESYKQKVLCSSYYGYCDVFDYGKYNISAKLSFEGKDIDLSKINGNTPFYMEVGDFYVYFLLGDGQYKPGKTSKSTSKTSVVLSDYDWVTDNENVQYMWIKLSWNTKKGLTIKIKGLTGVPDIMYPVISYNYLYQDPGSYNDNLSGSVNFGGAEWRFDTPSTISVKQRTKKDKYKDLWDLWFIKAKGTGYEVSAE